MLGYLALLSDIDVLHTLTLRAQIITSCLPVLRPVLKHIPRKLLVLLPFSSTNRTDRNTTSHPTMNCIKLSSLKPTKLSRTGSKPAPSSRIERIKTTLRHSDSEEQVIISPLEIQRPEEALVRSESHGSEWNEWRNSGVMKTVEVDVESSYVLSPSSPRLGNGAGGRMETRYEWE